MPRPTPKLSNVATSDGSSWVVYISVGPNASGPNIDIYMAEAGVGAGLAGNNGVPGFVDTDRA